MPPASQGLWGPPKSSHVHRQAVPFIIVFASEGSHHLSPLFHKELTLSGCCPSPSVSPLPC